MTKFTIYAADRAGCMWDVATIDDPVIALGRLHLERQLNVNLVHGVYDSDSPEWGDMEAKLEDQCWDDVQPFPGRVS